MGFTLTTDNNTNTTGSGITTLVTPTTNNNNNTNTTGGGIPTLVTPTTDNNTSTTGGGIPTLVTPVNDSTNGGGSGTNGGGSGTNGGGSGTIEGTGAAGTKDSGKLSTEDISNTLANILTDSSLTTQQQKDAANAFLTNNHISIKDAAGAMGVDATTATAFLTNVQDPNAIPTTDNNTVSFTTFDTTNGVDSHPVSAVGTIDSSGHFVDNSGGGGGGHNNFGGHAEEDAKGGLTGIAKLLYRYAAGGMPMMGHLGGYSDGGRLLRGPGDGVSDSIPASIGNRQPARLADGEFVVPARIVSELGNGSTEAGARQLYKMMDRIQSARKKTTGKNQVAANPRAEQYLPA